MSASENILPGPGVAAGLVTLHGRVSRRRKFGELKLTLLNLPAPDQYSQPGLVEVKGKEYIGEVGDTVTVRCRIGGYPRNFKGRDDEGQEKQIFSAQNTLEVVE